MNNRQEILQSLIEKLTRATHCMHTEHGFPFGSFMLRKQQIMILFFIYEKKEAASVKEIANFLHVTSGAVTQFVDGLVDKKLVKREENLLDRRSINIKLTEDTKNKFNDFRKNYLNNASQAFSSLSDEELSQFLELVKKIKAPHF